MSASWQEMDRYECCTRAETRGRGEGKEGRGEGKEQQGSGGTVRQREQ